MHNAQAHAHAYMNLCFDLCTHWIISSDHNNNPIINMGIALKKKTLKNRTAMRKWAQIQMFVAFSFTFLGIIVQPYAVRLVLKNGNFSRHSYANCKQFQTTPHQTSRKITKHINNAFRKTRTGWLQKVLGDWLEYASLSRA